MNRKKLYHTLGSFLLKYISYPKTGFMLHILKGTRRLDFLLTQKPNSIGLIKVLPKITFFLEMPRIISGVSQPLSLGHILMTQISQKWAPLAPVALAGTFEALAHEFTLRLPGCC
jgi:hypothetical protein